MDICKEVRMTFVQPQAPPAPRRKEKKNPKPFACCQKAFSHFLVHVSASNTTFTDVQYLDLQINCMKYGVVTTFTSVTCALQQKGFKAGVKSVQEGLTSKL